ncbi:NfeD family protein [Myxococcota bacterium]|jgi:membrane protein implicated in regulation of membrane protease activity|nr:NfeD family protein [Myxococcota bacterium]
MDWWIWLVVGIVLMVLEVVTPGFVLFFFGGAAVLLGGLLSLGIGMPVWAEFLLFSVLAVVLTVAFRGPLKRRLEGRPRSAPRVDRLEDETATPLVSLEPGATGQAELRGTVWKARNESTNPLAPGSPCRVVRVDGLTLVLAPGRPGPDVPEPPHGGTAP